MNLYTEAYTVAYNRCGKQLIAEAHVEAHAEESIIVFHHHLFHHHFFPHHHHHYHHQPSTT